MTGIEGQPNISPKKGEEHFWSRDGIYMSTFDDDPNDPSITEPKTAKQKKVKFMEEQIENADK